MFTAASFSTLPVLGWLRHFGGFAPKATAAQITADSKNTDGLRHADTLPASRAVGVYFEAVGKRYDSGESALSGIDLDIAAGEFVVLVGPSGCGKSSLLRMLAGLESISAGRILIDGQVVNDISPRERDIAMVFQDYALYPHKTVYDNLAFGLQVRGADKAAISQRVQEVAAQLKIGDLLQRKPAALSGGQRQRVAIGRALVRRARLFLFDEPLSNLDVKLRNEMRVELKKLHQQFGITTLYVTHDQIEAMTLGDRIAVMSKQGIEQYGTPQQIYCHPRTTFVAEFVGSPAMNLLTLPLVNSTPVQNTSLESSTLASTAHYESALQPFQHEAILGLVRLPVPMLAHTADDTAANQVMLNQAIFNQVILGIRPEHIQRIKHTGTASESVSNTLSATISFIEPLGAETIVTLLVATSYMVTPPVATQQAAAYTLRARWAPDPALHIGQTVSFSIADQHRLWFDAATGINLNTSHGQK